MSRTRMAGLAFALALLTVVLLLRGERSIGYVRDEGVYFEASRRYATWIERWIEEGGEANQPEVRDRYFGFNHEHPALMKLLAGVSAGLFAEAPTDDVADALAGTKQADFAALEGGRWPIMREGAAMRLPAILLTGLAAALLFLVGARLGSRERDPAKISLSAGVLAAAWFVSLPHVQFHASLHAFDVPIAVCTLVVALVWLRALRDWRFGLALGPVLGVAIAVKHNALFLGPLLTLHLWVILAVQWRQTKRRPDLGRWFALPLWSMLLLAPLTAVVLWPWLWHEPLTRIGEYFAFHSEHNYYNTEYFARNYNRPPLPISYPFVMTWATVPSVLLVLSGIGMLTALRNSGRRLARRVEGVSTGWSRPHASPDRASELLLYLMLALFPLLLIAMPSVPIFGGTKHWLTAYPFMALLAAFAWGRLWERAGGLLQPWPRWLRVAPSLVLVTVLIPSAWSTLHGHPFNLSQYSPLAGGARGGADMGLQRGFWGHAIVPLLEDGDAMAQGPVYVHDVHRLAVEQYRREGRWPAWQPANPSRARAGLIFPERHMLADEIELWEHLETVQPAALLTLDDVPVAIVYRAPD